MAKKREKVLDDTPATPEFAHAQREDLQEALIAKMREVHGIPDAPEEVPAETDIVELEYPGLRQNIPEILKAILKELIIRRKGA